MITFQCVPVAQVGDWWPSAEPWIVASLEHGPGLYAAQDVLDELVKGDSRLWVVCDGSGSLIGCATTSIQQFPQRTVMIIGPVGGERARTWIRGLDEHLRQYAKNMGCDAQLSEGRPGWDRLVGNGWTVTATQYVRELGE